MDSSLLAYGVEEGTSETEKYSKSGTVYSALASFTWQSYQKIGNILNDELNIVLFECENAKLVILQVSNMLLCLVGDKECLFGLMRTKAIALHKHLYPSLNKLNLD